MGILFSLLLAWTPVAESLRIMTDHHAGLARVDSEDAARAKLIARTEAMLARSKIQSELSVKIVAQVRLEMSETDPVKKAAAKAEKKRLYEEFDKVRDLPAKN